MISIIFIILSSTILAFEQLSKIDYNRRNYQILDKMGVAQKTRRNLIKKEVGVLFFIPAILPMIMMIFLIAGANQVFGEAILQENLFLTYGIVTLAVFGGIYLLYYWATTSVFQYAVLKGKFYWSSFVYVTESTDDIEILVLKVLMTGNYGKYEQS